MKVLALSSSQRMDKSTTTLILSPLIQGVREAGAEVELFYIKKLNLNPCQGCFSCCFKTPGKCQQKDDMQMLYPKLREADILVLATPVYFSGIPGPMKNLIDRMMPLWLPFIELCDGHCSVLPREGTKSSKIVLVSSCGYWEMDNFDLLLTHAGFLGEFAGALLRPHAEVMRQMMDRGEPLDDIFQAAKEAGHQLVSNGEMSTENLNIVGRELMPLETYIKAYNNLFQATEIKHAATP